jgi:aromatic-L-amino-acid/L-tryptophan decarboxylase
MYPLDPAPEDMRAMGEAALEYLIGFYRGLGEAPAENAEGGAEVARRLRAMPPERGGSFDEAFQEFRTAAEHSYEPAGPGYLAYIPGGGLYAAALASFLGLGVNRFINLSMTTPGLAQIEQNVCRWICDLFDYPAEARGLLTTGGSMANLSAIVTARHAKLGDEFLDGTYYVSDQAHASLSKAARIAGLPRRALRTVPTDDRLRMDPDALRAMIREDRSAGARPFLVVPSSGTTNTGAIDPMEPIADIAEDEGLWMHVDGAYGGFFILTDRGREWFAGIERADSVTLDPHKGLFLPYGTGSLAVRDGEALRSAHHETAAYLQDLDVEGEVPNFTEYSPELSRDMRGLRVWLPLKLHGVSAFREALDEKLDLSAYVHDALAADPRIDVLWPPQLTVIAFRLAGADDETQKRFLDRINASKRVFLSSTVIDGRYTLRICIVNHRTHKDRIEECIEIIGRAAAELAPG